jgi:hypothetical protein
MPLIRLRGRSPIEQSTTILEKQAPATGGAMEIRVRLVHADGQQRVVLVEAYAGERFLGAALGEAMSAEEAEDRGLQRLRQRLKSPAPSPSPRASQSPSPSASSASFPTPTSLNSLGSLPAEEPPQALVPSSTAPSAGAEPDLSDPEDWSADLSDIDRILKRLGWGREEERTYMQRLFGHPSRTRLTRYADLMLLRRALEGISPGTKAEGAPLPLRRSELLEQCDGLLSQLGWTTLQARQSLEQHFAVVSRQHLSDEQLLAFNLLLESEVLAPSQQA